MIIVNSICTFSGLNSRQNMESTINFRLIISDNEQLICIMSYPMHYEISQWRFCSICQNHYHFKNIFQKKLPFSPITIPIKLLFYDYYYYYEYIQYLTTKKPMRTISFIMKPVPIPFIWWSFSDFFFRTDRIRFEWSDLYYYNSIERWPRQLNVNFMLLIQMNMWSNGSAHQLERRLIGKWFEYG